MIGKAWTALAAATLFLPYVASASLQPLVGKPARAAVQPVASLSPPAGAEAPSSSKSAPPRASASDLHEEIRDLARQGQLDSALSLCRHALELDSSDAYARFMAGKLSPEGKTSAEHFKRVLDAGKGGPEAEESRFRLGQYHYAAGKYHQAIPYFRDYLRLHPKGDWKEPALYWMGSGCLALAQSRPDRVAYLDTGLIYLQKLLDLSPPEQYYHTLALEGMAKIRLAKGDQAGAWEAVQGALEKAPEDERAAILLLAAQLRRNVDREAERRLLERLAKEHPQSPEVRHLRRLNGGSDPARWRAPAVPGPLKGLAADSTLKPEAGPTTAAASTAGTKPDSVHRPGASSADGSSAAAGAYTLQMGAFAQPANAQGMVSELTRMGFSPEMAESTRGGKKIYQVRLGRFASAEEAQEYARVNLKPRKLLFQAILVN